MPTEIVITDEDIKYLNDPAKEQMRKHIEDYIDQLLNESSRLEAAHRTTDGEPEINSSMVNDAAHLIHLGYQKHKKPGWLTACQIVSMVSTLLTGLVFDFDRLKDPIMLVAFLVLLAFAIVFNVIVLNKD